MWEDKKEIAKISWKEIIELAKDFNLEDKVFSNQIYFASNKHWIKISFNLDGIPWVEKESREQGLCCARKAKSTSSFNPTKQYIVNCFKSYEK